MLTLDLLINYNVKIIGDSENVDHQKKEVLQVLEKEQLLNAIIDLKLHVDILNDVLKTNLDALIDINEFIKKLN